MEIANVAVKRSLALYCTRAWDHAPDAISVPHLHQPLPSSEHLRRERESWYGYPEGAQAIQHLEAEHSKLLVDLAKVDQSRIGSIRVFRAERLAHRVFSSSDRKRIEAKGKVADTTIKELVDFAELTVDLVGRFGLVLEGHVSPFAGLVERSQRYCHEFWGLLPKLGEVENQDIG